MKDRYQGILQTIWTGNSAFLDLFYGVIEDKKENGLSQVECFKQAFALIDEMKK